jgi:hypothetical protein
MDEDRAPAAVDKELENALRSLTRRKVIITIGAPPMSLVIFESASVHVETVSDNRESDLLVLDVGFDAHVFVRAADISEWERTTRPRGVRIRYHDHLELRVEDNASLVP